jgi:diguanylate cyclase (GGDEF)-like protein
MESKQPRILLIDDDPLMRHIVKSALAGDDYVFAEAHTGADGLAQALADRPDLILLDIMMPDMEGYEVCHRLRANLTTLSVPIVVLTALAETAEKVRGMQVGADDYVTKPFDPRELRSRIAAHLRRSARDLSASPLTNLPGNPVIEQVLRARLATREPLAVLYVDLTYFKSYNDVYGWLRGDQVIKMLGKQIAVVLLSAGAKDDFVGHVGGDDFVVISRPERAETIAREIIRRFDSQVPEFYSEADRARGYLQVFDRQGNAFHAPIISVSVAIVSNEQRRLEHPSQVADLAAEVKRYVKSMPGSQFAFDRRRK